MSGSPSKVTTSLSVRLPLSSRWNWPFRSRPMSGIGLPLETSATLPDSDTRRGEAAIADPTTEFAGQVPAWKLAGGQVLPSRFASATRSLAGTATIAFTQTGLVDVLLDRGDHGGRHTGRPAAGLARSAHLSGE